jgi:hypothetical protein
MSLLPGNSSKFHCVSSVMVASILSRQQMNSVILLPYELEVQMALNNKERQYATMCVNLCCTKTGIVLWAASQTNSVVVGLLALYYDT